VLRLEPDRLALFGYAHVPWMKAHQKLIDERELAGDLERLDQSETAAERLIAEGYVRIGLDHYARPEDALARAAAEGRLRRNFQGYTTDGSGALIGFGASAIGQLPDGYVQNAAAELSWRKAVAGGALATARGVAISPEDRLRADIIERLMCDLAVDVERARRAHNLELTGATGIEARLTELERDGLIERRDAFIRVTEIGRPFVRAVCAVFDAYLAPEALRHSRVV
jgi:oxygen-independent coproporphyrinogen-3 oxidase